MQHYPNGLEAELMGVVPPPGLYYRQFNIYYTADKLKDNSGHTLSLAKDGAELSRIKNDLTRVVAIGPHVWVPYKKWFFGGHVQFETAARNGPQGINVNVDFVYKFF